MPLPDNGLDLAAVKQKYLLRIEANEFLLLVNFSNGAELKVHMGSISKPETRHINEVLELVKMNDFEISIKLHDKVWELFKMDKAIYKKTFEEIESKLRSPKTKAEVNRRKIAFKKKKEGKSAFDDKQETSFRPKSDIVELINIRIAVPSDIDIFLDSFVLMAKTFLYPNNQSPPTSPKTSSTLPNKSKASRLFNFFNLKYILSIKGFKFTMEDNPLEVAITDPDKRATPEKVY